MFQKQYSQSYQDLFVYNLCGDNGTYIEIGGNSPTYMSNTYNLEIEKKWRGFSIELDTTYIPAWNSCPERKNKIFWGDALEFNYLDALTQLNFKKHINYLSCDIEPAENTFKALTLIISQGIEFDVITFEHDSYREGKDWDINARKFLAEQGYKVAVENVYYKKKEKSTPKHFETWFVNNKITFDTVDYTQWLNSVGVSY